MGSRLRPSEGGVDGRQRKRPSDNPRASAYSTSGGVHRHPRVRARDRDGPTLWGAPAIDCASLATKSFGNDVKIDSARTVPAAANLPEHCEVKGVICPEAKLIHGFGVFDQASD